MGLLRTSFIYDCGSQMTCELCSDYHDNVIFRCNMCWRNTFAKIGCLRSIQLETKANYDNCFELDN